MCVLFSLLIALFHRFHRASAAATTARRTLILRICLGRAAGIGLCRFGRCFIGQTADPNLAIGLFGKPHTDQELAMLGAGGQIHIPMTRLCKPAGTQHFAAAGGALVLLPCHSGQCCALIREVIEHFAADTAGKFCAVEAVLVAFSA